MGPHHERTDVQFRVAFSRAHPPHGEEPVSIDFAVDVIYNLVILTLLLSGPAVGAGMIVGLLISLFQAVTQIQEQTLTFVPKMVVVLLVFAFLSPWTLSLLIDFTVSLWSGIPQLKQ